MKKKKSTLGSILSIIGIIIMALAFLGNLMVIEENPTALIYTLILVAIWLPLCIIHLKD